MVNQRAGDKAVQFGQIGSLGTLNINSPRTPVGIPFQAPPLPSHFVDRPEVSQDLKKRLIADSTTHSGTLVISSIQGLGGIGKTILAQALAHDKQVQEHFCDGIIWATLGKQPDVLSLLQGWIVALKDYDYKPTTVNAASTHLNSLLHDKAVLLVIDDGWDVEDIEPFRVGSSKCQAIITTRRADVAKEVKAQLYSLDLMSEEQSLMLLARRLGRDLAEEEQAAAKKLAAEVGYLPIALDLAAARVARGKSWTELNSALTTEITRLEVLESVRRRSRKETRLEASFNLSLNVLREDFPEAWSSFVWLGVLPEDVSITAPMVATLWEVDIKEAADRLELFWNDALLLPGVPVRIGTEEWTTYRIHDLLHDLAIKWLTTKRSPGLGLTIPQAHNILLEHYYNNLYDKNWHKLVDDDYIFDHLTWHMEKAGCVDLIHQLLREETESKRNGWYLKCESLGKTAIFVGDVARAWKLAEAEYETNPSRAIGLQCRYALVTSSLNTIATNIPPELISALVEKKVWTTAQGLAYSRQVQSLPQRVEALSKLASYFLEIWSEALEVARNIDDEFLRAYLLRELARQLSENLVPEVLETARNISKEFHRAEILRELAPQLPENLVPEALEAARNIDDEFLRAYLLRELARQLPENLVPEALEAARNIGDEFPRAEVLSSIARQLPEIWPEALEAARNLSEESHRAKVISELAPQLSKNLMSEALEAARNLSEESHRAKVLSSLAPQLPKNLMSEALEAARNLSEESHQVKVLSSLAPQLPENLMSEALEAARNLSEESHQVKVLSSLAPHLLVENNRSLGLDRKFPLV